MAVAILFLTSVFTTLSRKIEEQTFQNVKLLETVQAKLLGSVEESQANQMASLRLLTDSIPEHNRQGVILRKMQVAQRAQHDR